MNTLIHAVFATLLAVASASAAPQDMLAGLIRAPMTVAVTLPSGARANLEGLVLRPDRAGRFPLVVMIHGTPRSDPSAVSEAMARVSPAGFSTAAVAFAQRGYAAVAVMRRGFGRSDGPYGENAPGRCEVRDYLPAVRRSGEDVAAAVAALRREPWADPDRVVLLGMSTGGFAVTAAASAGVPGVRAVLDFAGGRGSSAPDTVCNEPGLVRAFGELGRTVRTPALWIFSENDRFFGPDLARRMHAAYTASGAPAQFVMLPSFGQDGHLLVTSGPASAWWPTVEPFLAGLGLPTRVVIELPPLPELPSPPLRSAACQTGFADFQAARTPAKAFATSSGGHCGWMLRARTAEEAGTEALVNCNKFGGGCRLYAVGQARVPD